jgi:hypothetical protein
LIEVKKFNVQIGEPSDYTAREPPVWNHCEFAGEFSRKVNLYVMGQADLTEGATAFHARRKDTLYYLAGDDSRSGNTQSVARWAFIDILWNSALKFLNNGS